MTKSILEFSANHEPFLTEVTPKAKPKKLKKPRATSTERHYVTNAVLLPEIKRAKELGYVTPELAEMYKKIAERYAMSKNWAHLTFKEDMISNAILNLLQNGLKFDPNKSDQAFSYCTQCCFHSFLQIIAEEKKQREIRDTLLLDNGMNASLGYMEKEHDNYFERHSDFFNQGE